MCALIALRLRSMLLGAGSIGGLAAVLRILRKHRAPLVATQARSITPEQIREWQPDQVDHEHQRLDFNRCFVTFRIDLDKKASKTMSDVPPFSLNNARIPVDCVLRVRDKATGKEELVILGGNCKTETVGKL